MILWFMNWRRTKLGGSSLPHLSSAGWLGYRSLLKVAFLWDVSFSGALIYGGFKVVALDVVKSTYQLRHFGLEATENLNSNLFLTVRRSVITKAKGRAGVWCGL